MVEDGIRSAQPEEVDKTHLAGMYGESLREEMTSLKGAPLAKF